MRTVKKTLSVLLVIAMMLSLCAISAGAAGESSWISFNDISGGFAAANITNEKDGTAVVALSYDTAKIGLTAIDSAVNTAILAQNAATDSQVGSFYGETTVTPPVGAAEKDTEQSWTGFDAVGACNTAGDSSATANWPFLGRVQVFVNNAWTNLSSVSGVTKGTIESQIKTALGANAALAYGTNYRFVPYTGGTAYYKVYFMGGSNNVVSTKQYKIVYPQAQIGTKQYTLSDAVGAAAAGETVKLTSNVDISASGLYIDRQMTLDLNGHTLKAANTDSGNIDIATGGNVTLIDSSDTSAKGVGTGKIYTETDYAGSSTGFPAVYVIGSGSFTMNSGYIYTVRNDAANKGQFAVSAKDTASVTINGGKIEAGWYTISGNGSNANQNTTITVNGGELISTSDYSIYHPQFGSLNINGGTIYGAAGGIAMNRGTLNMAGGIVTSRGQGSTGTWGDGTGNLSKAAIYLNAKYGNVSGTISGGFVSAEGNAVTLATGTTYSATLSVAGGYYTSDPSAYIADGYKLVSSDNSSYAYKVAGVPVNKIESATAAVTAANGDATTEDASVAVSDNALTVSGKISAGNKVTVTYTCTDGKTGTITVTYVDASKVFNADPSAVTVGDYTYNVDVSGLTVLPSVVKVAAPEASATAPEGATSGTNNAVTAINTNADKVSASGLGAAVTDSTVQTSGTGDNASTNVTVGGANGAAETKTAAEVIDAGITANTGSSVNGITENNKENLVVVVQPIINIEVKSLTTDNQTNRQVLSLDISAQSQVVVTTKTTAVTDINTSGSRQNAVKVGKPVDVTVNDPVTLTIPVPAGFVASGDADNIFIEHTMHSGAVETVKATYNSTDGTLTFTVHGLSPITVKVDTTAATVNYPDNVTATYRVSDVGTALPTAAKAGYSFIGWTFPGVDGTYTTMTKELLDKLNGETAAATAQFIPVSSAFTLTFATNGGSAIAAVSRVSGTTVDLSAYVTSREGYNFAGWFSDQALTTAVAAVKLTSNTTVYAKWTAKSANPFSDVAEGSYYCGAVMWAVGENVTSGATPTTFNPAGTCTRAQAVTFLWRAMGSPEPTSAVNPFVDVSPAAYYYKAVLWAVEKNITSGITAAKFVPGGTVTRGQFAAFLWRAVGMPSPSGAANPFTDVTNTGAYYYSAVIWAVENGITEGSAKTTFNPGGPCTRAQIVTFLYRYFGK